MNFMVHYPPSGLKLETEPSYAYNIHQVGALLAGVRIQTLQEKLRSMNRIQIDQREHLSERKRREAEAAIARLGYSREKIAEEYRISYDNLRKAIKGQIPAWPKYAAVLNDLIERAELTIDSSH